MEKIIDKKVNKEEKSASYRIDFGNDMKLWFDVWLDYDEPTGDWNKYIFHNDDEEDMAIKAFQDAHNDEIGAYNYITAFELAVNEFENDLLNN